MAESPVINPFSSLATDPIRNFRFLVQFLPHDSTLKFKPTIGFVSVTGLNVTTESIAYREGGYNTTVHQIPGMTTFSPINFSRGVVMGSDQNVNWMRRLFATTSASGNGGVGSDFRCNIDISVLSHPNAAATASQGSVPTASSALDLHTALRFRVYNAWITNLAYSDLNAGDNNLFVESLTVVHEGWDVKYAADLKASAAQF